MKPRYPAFFIALLTLLLACNNEKKTQLAAEQQLRDEVMAIHDEVMPMMGELTNLAGQLKQVIQIDSTLDTTWQAQINQTVDKMVMAEEGMMDWMSLFKQPDFLRDTMEHQAIMDYLTLEKKKIAGVGEQIKTGINEGKTLLDKYQKEAQ